MEKGIECGVRITKELLLAEDAKWVLVEQSLIARCIDAARAQRKVFLQVESGASKDFDGYRVDKGVELYCRIKSFEVQPVEKSVECGIRIKQYLIELPDSAFEGYLVGAESVLRTALQEQRAAIIGEAGLKSFFDLTEVAKGAEFYCEIKSMCS